MGPRELIVIAIFVAIVWLSVGKARKTPRPVDAAANVAPYLNSGLFRVHRVFAIAYGTFTLVTLFLATLPQFGLVAASFSVVTVPLFLVHFFAAKGAKAGKTYGRGLSNVIAVFLLLGIPIGTIVGVYILRQTGAKWQTTS